MANAVLPSPAPSTSPPAALPGPAGHAPAVVERSLAELRSGRRLEKVAASIESFLLSQIARLEKSLAECEAAVGQNQVVQRILTDFERQKEAWERERQAEIKRLFEASEKLARGWKQLEDERQKWIADRPPGYAGKPS